MVPRAKVVELPEEVGPGGDVTDFFVRLGRSEVQFVKLLETAKPTLTGSQRPRPDRSARMQSTDALLKKRINRIKRKFPIEKVIGEYITLEPSGSSTLMGRCPFHQDGNSSLTVYPDTGTFHCFACRAHGDVITFVRAMEHLSFGKALDVLDELNSLNEPKLQQDNAEDKAA
jgi:hypothetical protein